MKRIGLLAIVVAALLAVESRASILTFDNIGPSPSGNPIPNGYGGFTWSNMYYLNGTTFGPSGYQNGRVSGDFVAYNGFGTTAQVADGVFTFNGAYFTGAWNNGLHI